MRMYQPARKLDVSEAVGWLSLPVCPLCRVWEAAYEQLQMEKGACNLLQKYSPEAVRERALSTPSASFQIAVCFQQLMLLHLTALTAV